MGVDLTATVAPPTWSTVAATVTGASHERDGSPCQDVVGVAADDDRTVVLVAADGAGSAVEGGTGAAVAVRAALAGAAAALAEGVPLLDAANRALDDARAAVEETAGTGLAAHACTLVVAIARVDDAAVACIGDSVAVVSAQGDLVAVTGEAGEYVNETVFLTSATADEARVARSVDGPIDGVAVFSDGLSLLALDTLSGAPHAPFFAPLFAFARGDAVDKDAALAAFLASPRVRDRTDDDVSLALAVPGVDAPG